MKINAHVVNIKTDDGDDLWFVRTTDNVLHQVRDIAALGPGRARTVEALVIDYPNGAINIPDDQIRFKGGNNAAT